MELSDSFRTFLTDSFIWSCVSPANTCAACGFTDASRKVSTSETVKPKAFPFFLPCARYSRAPPTSTRIAFLPLHCRLSYPRPTTSQLPSHASTAKPSATPDNFYNLSLSFCKPETNFEATPTFPFRLMSDRAGTSIPHAS